jgi:opacity protein-like surface antigen
MKEGGMKRVLATATVLAVALFVTGPASAQVEEGKFYAGPLAGVAFPFGDLGDVAGIGFAVGGTGDYMATPVVGIGADLVLNFFGGEEFGGADVTWRITQIGGHARYFFSPMATTNPYVQGGLGIYNAHVKVEVPGFGSGSDSESKFGFNAGGGVILNAGTSMKLNIAGTVHIVTTEGSSSTYLNGTVALLFPFGG